MVLQLHMCTNSTIQSGKELKQTMLHSPEEGQALEEVS